MSGFILAVLLIVVASVASFTAWGIQRTINNRATTKADRWKVITDAIEKVGLRLTALEKKDADDSQTLALLKQEMLPMIEATKRKLVEILLHPSDEFVIPDAVLAKVLRVGDPLNDAEKFELEAVLNGRAKSTNPHVTEVEKLAAKALLPIIELAELEALQAPEAVITAVQLVTSTAKTAATKKAEEKAEEGKEDQT